MCQDPRKIQDPGSGILKYPRSWVGVLIQDPVDPGSCQHSFCRILWILDLVFRKVVAGSWGSQILLREDYSEKLAQVAILPLNKRFCWTVQIFGACCNSEFFGSYYMEGYRGHTGSNVQDFAISALRSVLSGHQDCPDIVAMFSLSAPSRRSRRPELFHVPRGRMDSVGRGFLVRLPQLVNSLMNRNPQTDLFLPSSNLKSEIANFADSQGRYLPGMRSLLCVFLDVVASHSSILGTLSLHLSHIYSYFYQRYHIYCS